MFNVPRGKHGFAKNRRRLWLQAIKRADWGPDGAKGGETVCSAHFITGEPSFDCDSPDFVPSIFPHSSITIDSSGKVARYERKRRRESRAPDERPGVMPDLESAADELSPESALETKYRELREDYSSLKRELEAVQEENQQLKEKLKKSKFRLDYCNALLAGLPACATKPLQMIQNAAARLVFNEPKRAHVTPLFISLHWLPLAARIKFKALTLAYRTITGSAPSYFHSLLRVYIPTRHLRSVNERRLVVPSQKATKSLSRTFSFTVPCWWNALPTLIRNAESLTTFKKQLKTNLFREHLTL
ncbi:unnamed protein product [Leuciscus chuanchicus]